MRGLDLLWPVLLPEAIASVFIFTAHYMQWAYNHLLELSFSGLSSPLDMNV